MLNPAYRILIVDDEPLILRVLTRALARSGFVVDSASNGHSALAMVHASARPYDLLITDVAMPGMNGLDLVEFTEDVSPTTKILVISAYLPETRRGMEGLPFIQKPFAPDALTSLALKLCQGSRQGGHPTLFLYQGSNPDHHLSPRPRSALPGRS